MITEEKKAKLKERILQLFYRHTKEDDLVLSDRDFVQTLTGRYNKYLQEELVDVGE